MVTKGERMRLGCAITYVPDVEATIAFSEQAFGLKRGMVVEGGEYGELDTALPAWPSQRST